MTSTTARIAAVNTLPLGSVLASAAALGATTLTVEDAADFDASGGMVLIGGTEIATFTAADDEAGTLTLSAPTAAAWDVDTRVELWDVTTGSRVVETIAQVLVEGTAQGGDSLEAVVDHALIPFLAEGIRETDPETGLTGEAVAIEWRGGELVVVNVIGQAPVMDGTVIDPDTLPPSGGATPEVPAVPAAPSVIGGIGSLFVQWGAVIHPNPVTYEVHVSPTPGLTPSATTFVGEVSGTRLTVRRLPIPDPETGSTDVPLEYGVTYSVAIVAKDSVDPTFASAKSAEGTGSPIQASAGDLAADSVTAVNIAASSLTGDLFAGELLLGSRIATAESGQRVEMSPEGFRLYNSAEELRVNLPTDPAQDPSFRGRVEADGLTVRQGASFYSTLNEFAKDSRISLAEQVAAPVAAPTVGSFWESVTQDTTPRSGSLGTFAFDASLISNATYLSSFGVFAFVQRVPSGGARIWYMNLDGTFNDLWDLPSTWHVTSAARGADGEWKIMLRYEPTGVWYIYDYSQPSGSRYLDYARKNTSREPLLTIDGSDVWVVESFSDGPRFYRMTMNVPASGTTTAQTVLSSGSVPVGGQITNSPWTFMRTAADFGSSRFIVSYSGSGVSTSSFRVYNSSGVHQPAETWQPPSAKATGFWDPTVGRFRTLGLDNKAYRHSALTWTDPALDTWHLAQSFYDGQATGGTHETVIGAIRTFQPIKRSWVRITPASVPYTGGTDDPNISRIYGKTGSVPPAIGTGMYLQETILYSSPIRDRSTLLVTTGTTPPTTSNFPGATPARLVSARTLPSDGTQPIIDLRGDGSGRLGPFIFDGTGKFDASYDSGWVAIPADSGGASSLMGRRVGNVVYLRGSLDPSASWVVDTTKTLLATLPTQFRPSSPFRFVAAPTAVSGDLYFNVQVANNITARANRTAGVTGVFFPLTYLAD